MYPYIPHELSFVQKLLEYRVEFLNPFFQGLHYLDSGLFYVFVATTLFCLVSPRLGLRCFLLISITVVLNYSLKLLFAQPRPIILDPSLALATLRSPYGLPSGAAQAVVSLGLFLSSYFRSKQITRLLLVYGLLICVSRVYVGAHFPSDVIVGALIGYGVFRLFQRYIDTIESTILTFHSQSVGFSLLGIGILLFMGPKANAYQFFWGIAITTIAAYHYCSMTGSLDAQYANELKFKLWLIGIGTLGFIGYFVIAWPLALPLGIYAMLHMLTLIFFWLRLQKHQRAVA